MIRLPRAWPLVLLLGLACGSPAPAAKPVPPQTAAAPGGATAAAPPGAPPIPITVAHAAMSPNVTPLWVAADLDFDRQYGLDVTIERTRTGALTQAALVSGDIDYAWAAFATSLTARAGGSDVVWIGATTTRAAGELVTRPEITTADGLRGKKFGVQSFGGSPHVRTLQALKLLGLDVDRDNITILTTGEEQVTAAAMLDGIIDAASISYAAAADLKAAGYPGWDLGALGVRESSGMITRQQVAREKPEETRRLLRALGAALAYMKSAGTDPVARERVGQVVADRLRTGPEAVLMQLDLMRDYLPLDMRVPLEEGHELATILEPLQPNVRGVRFDEFLDFSFLDQLEQEGFFASLAPR